MTVGPTQGKVVSQFYESARRIARVIVNIDYSMSLQPAGRLRPSGEFCAAREVSKSIFILRILKHKLCVKSLLTIYYAFIHSPLRDPINCSFCKRKQ